MSDDKEYIVESITAARVKKSAGRNKNWEYRVRWEGYSEKDDTWEPTDSFAGSEHFIERFWARASGLLNGRDIDDLNAFKVGEEFFPVGPPLKKRKSQRSIKDSSSAAVGSNQTQTPKSKKRPRSSTPNTPDLLPEDSPPKRTRQSANSTTTRVTESVTVSTGGSTSTKTAVPVESARRSTRKSRLRREPSVVPPSEDEDDDEIQFIEPPVVEPPRFKRRLNEKLAEGDQQPDAPISARRARVVNTRVQTVDALEQGDLDGRLSGKGKDNANGSTGASASSASVKRKKPGPGRSSEGLVKPGKSKSSLLTFDKGQLKTIKGKYVVSEAQQEEEEAVEDVVMVSDDPPPVPPTGGELLKLASLGAGDAEELENFEDGEGAREPTPAPEPNPTSSDSILQRSLSLAKESLFPSALSGPAAAIISSWKNSTIFGPLGLGSESQSSSVANRAEASEVVQTLPFSIKMDVTSKLPVALTALSSTDAPIFDKVARNTSNGPPGKFYSNEAAIAMLDTFRTGGGSAKVILAPNATESEARDFEKFHKRLSQKELFVFMVGVDLLVFCSANATLIAQRMNFPTTLLNESGSVLVGRVNISNYSAYANAALQVDNLPW